MEGREGEGRRRGERDGMVGKEEGKERKGTGKGEAEGEGRRVKKEEEEEGKKGVLKFQFVKHDGPG